MDGSGKGIKQRGTGSCREAGEEPTKPTHILHILLDCAISGHCHPRVWTSGYPAPACVPACLPACHACLPGLATAPWYTIRGSLKVPRRMWRHEVHRPSARHRARTKARDAQHCHTTYGASHITCPLAPHHARSQLEFASHAHTCYRCSLTREQLNPRHARYSRARVSTHIHRAAPPPPSSYPLLQRSHLLSSGHRHVDNLPHPKTDPSPSNPANLAPRTAHQRVTALAVHAGAKRSSSPSAGAHVHTYRLPLRRTGNVLLHLLHQRLAPTHGPRPLQERTVDKPPS